MTSPHRSFDALLEETVASLLDREPLAAHVFIRRGMACVGCSMSRFERLADALVIHGIQASAFDADLKALRAPVASPKAAIDTRQGEDLR
jgi:hybrid cluster-associated redox disulfide protein